MDQLVIEKRAAKADLLAVHQGNLMEIHPVNVVRYNCMSAVWLYQCFSFLISNFNHFKIFIIFQSNVLLTNEQEKHVPTCPLHGSSEDSLKARNIKTVGLAEALDVMGIPPDLVTILKSVHHFINRLRTANMKNRAESSFLRHLNTLVMM